jgi:hypothetical protein
MVAKKSLHFLILFQAGGLIVELLFGVLFLRSGYGIAGVALASTFAYAFYGITVLCMAVNFVLQTRKEKIFFISEIFSIFLVGLLSFLFASWAGWIVGQGHEIIKVIVQLLASGLIMIPLLFWFNRRVQILSFLKKENRFE